MHETGQKPQVVASLCAIVAAAAALALPAPSEAAVQARPADSFVNSIGVNVHIAYEDTPYGERFGEVRQKLEELGVLHVRDELLPERPDEYQALGELANAGIGSTLILGSPAWEEGTLEELVSVVKNELSGDLDAVEGPNEYSTSGDPDWKAHLIAFQQQLFEDVKEDPALSSLPVIGPSIVHGDQEELGDISSLLDYGNIHSYPQGNPPDKLGSFITHARLNSGAKPIMATETGYDTALNWSGENPGVSEQAMATYMPRLFLEYFRWGIARTFSYELVDEHPDPGEAEREDHFGLLRNDLSEKPAFVALRNTIHLLEDPGTAFAPGSLDYTLSEEGTELPAGESPDLHKVLLEKRDGTFYLALWRLSSVWDPVAMQSLYPPDKPVTLTIPPGIEAAAEYLPNSSPEPVWSVSQPTEPLTIEVGPQVAIVKLTPGFGGSSPAADPVIATGEAAPGPAGAPANRGCIVPKLRGRALKAARVRLEKSGCRIGKVSRAKGTSGQSVKVVGQRPRPGAQLAAKARIGVTLG